MGGWIDKDRVNHIVDTGRCNRRDAKTILYNLKGAKFESWVDFTTYANAARGV